MPIYTVHLPPETLSDTNRRTDTTFIKDGFSRGAFFFTIVWMLAQRLWLWSLIAIAIVVAVVVAGSYFGFPAQTVLGTLGLLMLLLGLEGNMLIRRKLEKTGWIDAGLVSGATMDDAERRYFDATSVLPGTPPRVNQ